jgi:hypothetical protein
VKEEFSKMGRTAGMEGNRECLLPQVRKTVNGVRKARFSRLCTDLRTIDETTVNTMTGRLHIQ